MVRSEDPPGNVKHLRFGRPGWCSESAVELLKQFPGVKCVVIHTHGKKGEHPHYHVWWEGEKPVTNQTIRDRLGRYNPEFKAFSGQNDWSFRNHDSWESWAAYVCDNWSHKVLLSYRDIDTISEHAPKLPIVVGPSNGPAPLQSNPPPAIVIKEKKTTMREKFIFYLERELGWKRGVRNPSPLEVHDELLYFWEAAFNNPQAIVMCRHARWVFSDDDVRKDVLKAHYIRKIIDDI